MIHLRIQRTVLLAGLLIAGQCARPEMALPAPGMVVASNDPELSILKVELLYRGQPFTGTLVNRNSETRNETPHVDGLIHGIMRDFYHDGRLAAEYHYEKGKQVGTDRGWWPNGKMKFFSEHRDGVNHGESFAWDDRGLLVEYARYAYGRQLGRKVWWRSGEIFQNYANTDTRSMGLPGGKLCFKITAGLPAPAALAARKTEAN